MKSPPLRMTDSVTIQPSKEVIDNMKLVTKDMMGFVGAQDSISSLSLCVNDSAGVTTFDECYDMGDVLGEGGFAVVYRCQHKANKRSYAVKEIINSDYEDAGENMHGEIAALKRLRDGPFIVRLLDVFLEPERTYMIMEELKGGDLLERITEKEVYSEREARRVSRSLLEAVKFCHKKRICHRDIKPENILVDSVEEDTKIKLADFGCSGRITGRNCLHTLCGTAAYVAPDVIMESDGYDERCDLWSVGVVIYAMLAGYQPFEGEEEDLPHIICAGDYEFHEEYWNHISEKPKDLIRNLLIVDSDERATVEEALDSEWLCRRDKDLMDKSSNASFNSWLKFHQSDSTVTSVDLNGSLQSLGEVDDESLGGSNSSLCLEDL